MNDKIELMIADGSMELAGVDSEGNPLYTINPEVCKELHPEVYSAQYSTFLDDIQQLWELGYLDLAVASEQLEITLTETSREPGDDLSEHLTLVLAEVVRVFDDEG